jgi:3-hydroxybutyryl-CoA dehydrogenase
MASIQTVGIVGGGFMGSGIAESCARSDLSVLVYEPQAPALERSEARIRESLGRAVSRGRLSAEELEATIDRIAWTTELEHLTEADVAIEAVTEDPRIKGKLFQQLDELLPDAIFLASNTSSIPIAQIGAWTTRPERVLGLHFFSPVPVMSLVEVVVGYRTDPEVVAAAKGLAEAVGKYAVETKDRSGFIVNFLLVPYLMSGIRMFQDGFASREDIDEAMVRGCGHPMGPLTLADFIGLDVLYAIGDALFEEFKQAEYAPPPLLQRMVVSGAHGRKTGKGFYDYPAPPAG